jgi:hypothetical protein
MDARLEIPGPGIEPLLGVPIHPQYREGPGRTIVDFGGSGHLSVPNGFIGAVSGRLHVAARNSGNCNFPNVCFDGHAITDFLKDYNYNVLGQYQGLGKAGGLYVSLTATAIPEPGGSVPILAGLALIAFRRLLHGRL